MSRTSRALSPLGMVIVAGVVVLLAGPVFLVARQGSAGFAASDTFGVNQVASATVEISSGDAGTNLEIESMVPGDTAMGQLEVVNIGSLRVRYSMSSVAGESLLATLLRWDLWRRTGATCSPEPPAGAIVSDALLGDGTTVFGDVAVGADLGDQVLDAGASETWCFRVRLPLGTPDRAQGLTLDQQFVVYAEQFPEEDG